MKEDILYVSGEESPAQIRMRADRLGVKGDRIIICAQTCFEVIAEELAKVKPSLCIIDSIQTLYSESVNGTPGSVSQAREVTAGLIRIAKSNGLPIILVGHVTKDGNIAGPKTLSIWWIPFFTSKAITPALTGSSVRSRTDSEDRENSLSSR